MSAKSLDDCSPLHPRNGAPKRTADVAVKPGMRSRTAPSHDFLHGSPIDDEPNVVKSYENKISIHSGMTAKQKAEVHPIANSAEEILRDAARFGKPEGC